MRISFTDQRLTAHGGLAVWTRFITEQGLRAELRRVLPHAPTSPNAYDPTDTALGFIGGILCGADKLARVAHLAHDPAVAEVLGIEAIPSQSTLFPVLRPLRPRRRRGLERTPCLGGARAARPPRRLHAGSGLVFPDPRGRPAGGRAGRLYPQGAQAVPPAHRGDLGRGAAGRALLAAPGQHGLRQRRER